MDFNHSFHQFPMDESSRDLFVFHMPWGLHRLNTLVMGTHTGSSELQERVRVIVDGLEGVAQIKDDVVIHGAGKQHDERLKKFLERIEEHELTLRREKCRFGVSEVMWFGNIFNEQGMSADPAKVRLIKDWKRPEDKAGVKSFLQTAAFCQVFMRPGAGRTYADVTLPLRRLTAKSVKFEWTADCESSFRELKELLGSEQVMGYFDPQRATRLYVDEGPAGVAATVAQEYEVDGMDHTVWRPVHHTSRAKTKTEMNYGKVDGESLGILTGIKSNSMYLYGQYFEVVVDHEPLVNLYNRHSKEVTVRVAKHKSKLLSFNFDVIYQPGVTNPCDFASRNPPPDRRYSEEEKERLGVEEEEEDQEILVCRAEEMTDAVTLPVLTRHSQEDSTLQQLVKDIKHGRLSKGMQETGFKECFLELSTKDGLVLRGERLVIPKDLQAEVLDAAHQGHPGRDSMLQQLRVSVWWPGLAGDVRNYVDSCVACVSAVDRNQVPPMQIRETPDGPWQHCSADFKGPIGGKYYFHVLIDNYSRWPEVSMVKSTSFQEVQKRLEDSFAIHGVPESITHDNGPPYQSRDWQRFASQWGFQKRPCTPEHPQANGIAERFMSVLVKIVHTAIASGQDPKVAVRRRLLNYRNTPHPSTGKTPAELMIKRVIRTRLPRMIQPATTKVDREAKLADKTARDKRKERFDKAKHAKDVEIKKGDKVVLKQKKSSVKSPYDPRPYTVTEVAGNQVTAEREGKQLRRNKAKVKQVKERHQHLRRQEDGRKPPESDEEEDVEINLPDSEEQAERAGGGEAGGEGERAREEQEIEESGEEEGAGERGDGEEEEAGVRRSTRRRKAPEIWDPSTPNPRQQRKERPQLSPRDRRRLQAEARHGRQEKRVRMASGEWRKLADWEIEGTAGEVGGIELCVG